MAIHNGDFPPMYSNSIDILWVSRISMVIVIRKLLKVLESYN